MDLLFQIHTLFSPSPQPDCSSSYFYIYLPGPVFIFISTFCSSSLTHIYLWCPSFWTMYFLFITPFLHIYTLRSLQTLHMEQLVHPWQFLLSLYSNLPSQSLYLTPILHQAQQPRVYLLHTSIHINTSVWVLCFFFLSHYKQIILWRQFPSPLHPSMLSAFCNKHETETCILSTSQRQNEHTSNLLVRGSELPSKIIQSTLPGQCIHSCVPQ